MTAQLRYKKYVSNRGAKSDFSGSVDPSITRQIFVHEFYWFVVEIDRNKASVVTLSEHLSTMYLKRVRARRRPL